MVSFGIVGTGGIAAKFAQAIRMTPCARLAGVASRSEERGARFAEQYGAERVYESAQAMAASFEIDVLYIATPHTQHFEGCMAGIQAGKHVLCEKPMATCPEDAMVLFAQARKQGVLLMEGMWTRFLPNILRAKRWIEAGSIGSVRFIDGMFSFYVEPETTNPRLVKPEYAGGGLFDVGVYVLEMAAFFAGCEADRWDGLITPLCDGVDGTAAMTLAYPNGALATLRAGIRCPAPETMTIYGDKGRIELPRFFAGKGAKLFVGDALREEHELDCELPGGFTYEIEHVCALIEAGKLESDVATADMTIAAAGIMRDVMHRAFPEWY